MKNGGRPRRSETSVLAWRVSYFDYAWVAALSPDLQTELHRERVEQCKDGGHDGEVAEAKTAKAANEALNMLMPQKAGNGTLITRIEPIGTLRLDSDALS